MPNEILDEVYAAREKLWQRGGGTMRGLGEYLRECGRRAKARGVMWIESEEEREAIGAEVRARLAAEAAGEAMCVGEPMGEYRAVGAETHTEAQRDGGTEGEGENSRGDAEARRGKQSKKEEGRSKKGEQAHAKARRDRGAEILATKGTKGTKGKKGKVPRGDAEARGKIARKGAKAQGTSEATRGKSEVTE